MRKRERLPSMFVLLRGSQPQPTTLSSKKGRKKIFMLSGVDVMRLPNRAVESFCSLCSLEANGLIWQERNAS